VTAIGNLGQRQRQLWVRLGSDSQSASCPLSPWKRTPLRARVTSASCLPGADIRKRYRDPNDVERSCHNLRAGARVLAGNLHPALRGRPAATSRECAQSHILAAYLVAKSAYRGDAFRKLFGWVFT
jgi:hypothetical protein